jgi:cobalt/nickel transport system permease protein
MHFHSFDSYQQHSSPVHNLDPRSKVILTITFILVAVLLPDGSWGHLASAWLIIMTSAALAQISFRYLLTRSLIALPFALAAVTVLFTMPGHPVTTISLGKWALTVSDAGLIRFLTIIFRSWLAVQATLLLTATTQFPDLVHALRHLRVPALLTSILSFMYRYLFVLADEATRLLRARDSRSANLDGKTKGGSLRWRARIAGGMIGQLFLRSYDRSDRVYNAMVARGYNGKLLTMNPHHMHRTDWLTLFVGVTLLLIILISGSIPN